MVIILWLHFQMDLNAHFEHILWQILLQAIITGVQLL